tara:strand:- start:268 stop:546 length:279 start_codon:yes stop_codon:yes gene_type:complete
MCGGGGGGSRQAAAPVRMAPAPAIRTPPPVRNIPTPERIAEEMEDPNIITGQKRDKLKADQVRQGVKVFDAIDPSMNINTPTQGIPKIKKGG